MTARQIVKSTHVMPFGTESGTQVRTNKTGATRHEVSSHSYALVSGCEGILDVPWLGDAAGLPVIDPVGIL